MQNKNTASATDPEEATVFSLKRLSAYTNEGLLALTQPELDNVTRLECAHKGIDINPGPAPVQSDLHAEVPKATLGVSVVYVPELVVEDEDVARGILAYIRGIMESDGIKKTTSSGYDYNAQTYFHDGPLPASTSVDLGSVRSECLYATREQANAAMAIRQANNETKESHEKNVREWEDATDGYEEIEESVRVRVREAMTDQYNRKRAESRWAEYLELAGGVASQAWVFITKAHPEVRDYLQAPESAPESAEESA